MKTNVYSYITKTTFLDMQVMFGIVNSNKNVQNKSCVQTKRKMSE